MKFLFLVKTSEPIWKTGVITEDPFENNLHHERKLFVQFRITLHHTLAIPSTLTEYESDVDPSPNSGRPTDEHCCLVRPSPIVILICSRRGLALASVKPMIAEVLASAIGC